MIQNVVGENIVDATLNSGTGITTPFTALGFPGPAHHMITLYGDGEWGTPLSFAGFVSVSVEDEYNNPVSNIPVTFTVAPPEQNKNQPEGAPNCTVPVTTNTNAYLVEVGTACINDAPTYGTCGDPLKSSLTVTTDYTGAAAQVILGGMEDAIYKINASVPNISKNVEFKLYTDDFYYIYGHYNSGGSDPCNNIQDPITQLFVAYTYQSDRQGNSIIAGKVGATMPVQAKIYSLIEKWDRKTVSKSCWYGTKDCDKRVGNRQYDTTTEYTSSSVSFSGITGESKGGGIFTAQTYTLKRGLNEITIDATASLNVSRTQMTCSTCKDVDESVTQTASTTMKVYGVDVIVQDPAPVFLEQKTDGNFYSVNNVVAQYEIAPAEYGANKTALVMLLKNDEPIAYVSSVSDLASAATGTGTFLNGFQFDTFSDYYVQVVLNYGSGAEIKSDKKKISFYRVELVNKDDKPIKADDIRAEIGKDEKFVSWETLEIKYRITPITSNTPAIPDVDYDWDVTAGKAIAEGHSYLGTPDPQNTVKDKANRVVKFTPGIVKDTAAMAGTTEKAKPLAFVLNFKYKGQTVYKFPIEQNYKNAIREEYRVYRDLFEDRDKIPADAPLPTYTDFDEGLKGDNSKYNKSCSYDAADVPKGTQLVLLGSKLPDGKYRIDSAYRNPYRNQSAGSTSARSTHAWSGAFDLKSADGTPAQLKEVWKDVKGKSEFQQVYVESNGTDLQGAPDIIKKFLEGYITETLKKSIVSGSLTYDVCNIAGGYSIVWSKAGDCGITGWKEITFSWKETEKQVELTKKSYQLKEEDFENIARNLHAQNKLSDGCVLPE